MRGVIGARLARNLICDLGSVEAFSRAFERSLTNSLNMLVIVSFAASRASLRATSPDMGLSACAMFAAA